MPGHLQVLAQASIKQVNGTSDFLSAWLSGAGQGVRCGMGEVRQARPIVWADRRLWAAYSGPAAPPVGSRVFCAVGGALYSWAIGLVKLLSAGYVGRRVCLHG